MALAGVNTGVLSLILSNVTNAGVPGHEIDLELAGLVNGTHQHWAVPAVDVGDRLEVAIVDAADADRPAREDHDSTQFKEEAEREYYERLKAKYG